MICFPNAKINLGLSITKKRPDGMHNIETCYVPIPLFDILEIQPSDSFSIEHFGLPIPGNPDDNLIVKTWNLLLSVKKNLKPVKVYLYKNIPIGSGLGGGSSNATFFLKAINTLFSLGFSSTDLQLMLSEIGADCPFFVKNKTTIAKGIGNIFSPINNPIHGIHITIVFSDIHISSKDVFSQIKQVENSNLITVLDGNKSDWKSNLKNNFEEIVFKDYPKIKLIKETLYKSGAIYASLTGSGSAVYALSENPINTYELNDEYYIWTGIVN